MSPNHDEQGILTLLNGLVKAPERLLLATLMAERSTRLPLMRPPSCTAQIPILMQYYMQWNMRGRHQCKHRDDADVVYVDAPVRFGDAYVNLLRPRSRQRSCQSLSGDNLARLMKIKAEVDPKNIFKHAQSVPLS